MHIRAHNIIDLCLQSEQYIHEMSQNVKIEADTTLIIYSQNIFCELPTLLTDLSKSNTKNFHIVIKNGYYYYTNNFLEIPEQTNVWLEGQGAILMGIENPINKTKSDYKSFYYNKTNGKDVNFWSKIMQSDSLVSVVNANKKLCTLKVKNTDGVFVGDYIQVSIQWHAPVCKVVEVTKNYITFKYDHLKFLTHHNIYDINRDYIFFKKYPRYRIWHRQTIYDNIVSSDVGCFAYLKDRNFGTLKLSGLEFRGSAQTKNALLTFSNIKCRRILIDSCIFTGCKSKCINVLNTNNVNCSNCYFSCTENGIRADNTSSGLIVSGCTFINNNRAWTNSSCVSASGTDFYIGQNKFVDFEYKAIGVGVHYTKEKSNRVSGIIENNEIYYTQPYMEIAQNNNFMDAGCIYTGTQCDNVIIRYNFIHDYDGVHYNRGIFCDDGSKNLSIYGNLILNIKNSYSIDSRLVKRIVKENKSKVTITNINNKIFDNIVDNSIRLEGLNVDNNNCKYGGNLFLQNNSIKKMSNVFKNIEMTSNDVKLGTYKIINGKVEVSNTDMKILKELPFYNKINQYFK